ncbi:uncharacterized protein N7515_009087 [Penicillium bovifimosum]|uniref:Uncharacterized protein n=1 Tax=Penicillium bovifimosum TaxID=126998 RepID=A0A9W9GIZ1_9EURO|nr:uncharacterized protein N7515_009087 [Penicillium bovifimosum]KAJ5121126.1 hypothetical protein N7515_009087 [Penicillium bovifimosum]
MMYRCSHQLSPKPRLGADDHCVPVSDKSDADILQDGLDPIWPEVFGSQPFDQRDDNIIDGGSDSIWPEVGWPVLCGELPDDELFLGVSLDSSDNGGNSEPLAEGDRSSNVRLESRQNQSAHGVVGQVLRQAVAEEDVVRDDASQRAEAESEQKDVEQDDIVVDTIQDRKISDEGKRAKDKANDAVDNSDATLPPLDDS